MRFVTLTLLAAALVLACIAAAASVGARPRADFTFLNGAEVSSLDPQAVTGIPEQRLLRALYEGLVVRDPRTLAPLPGMATHWETSADQRTWTFHLRRGTLWTNGDEVRADDFVCAIEHLRDPREAAEFAHVLHDVRAVRTPDEHTLVIELERAVPHFEELASFTALYPRQRRAHEELLRRFPSDWRTRASRPEFLVTNGPYRLVERRLNDRARLEKHAGYWDADNVAFRTIDVLASEHVITNLNLYLTGEAGWLDEVPTSLVPRLRAREDFRPAPYLGTAFYRVNVKEPPFDDRRVRRALALTIDREQLTAHVTRAGEAPLFGYVPPGIAGWKGAELAHRDLARDTEEARALLVAAGFGPGGRPFPHFELHFPSQASQKDIAEVIADGWRRRLGLDVRLHHQEWKVFLASQRAQSYTLSRSMWSADFADPANFLEVFASDGANNRTGWSDARYDALLARARDRLDRDERYALLAEAEALLLDELPILPLYSFVSTAMVDPRLGGLFGNALDQHSPKFWYWMDDHELEAKRALLPPGVARVASFGPRAGLYAPAATRPVR